MDNFSAFPFESFLQTIKKMLRSGNKPLQQVFNRISEVKFDNHNDRKYPYSVSNNKPDNCFLTLDNRCIIVK